MVPTKKVEKTPYEVWHGQAPKLSYLKVWGCEALVKRDTLTKPDKLEPRSIKCIFIGYPKETMGYSFYFLPKNKVLIARNAEFLENSLINQEASGSLDDLEMDEPQSDILPIRRSTRTRHPTDRMCLYIDAEEHELGDLDNKVWVLVELPPNGKTVGSKWLFKKKTNMDGAVHTYKARLVAKGYTQTLGIDYEVLININPGDLHWTIVKNILKYLKNTKDMFLVYGVSGYVFVLNGGAVDWKSAKQIIFATLSAEEATYICCFDATTEAVMGARHFLAKVYYLREVIEFGDIKLEKVHTYDNLADPFTKALAFPKHSELTRNIRMLPASSLIHSSLAVLNAMAGQYEGSREGPGSLNDGDKKKEGHDKL
ncbi:retrotransposon protein, putative, ty1-copia subclass [Tanacetum coccineum]